MVMLMHENDVTKMETLETMFDDDAFQNMPDHKKAVALQMVISAAVMDPRVTLEQVADWMQVTLVAISEVNREGGH